MFSCLPSIFMYFNQLQPTLLVLRVSRCTQCSLLPVYAITRGRSIFWPVFVSPHPPQDHIFCTSNQVSKRNMEDATPPFIWYEYGKMLVYIQSGHRHPSALHERLELLHTHIITISSCLVLDSSPVAHRHQGLLFQNNLVELQSLNSESWTSFWQPNLKGKICIKYLILLRGQVLFSML